MRMTSQTISVFIGQCPADAYAFISDPANLPQWATAFCKSIAQSAGVWIADTSVGSVHIKFVDRNQLGVLDHHVALPSGTVVYVPMRVIPNRDGSEVMVTLLRLPDTTDTQFAKDGRMVEQDLQTLKNILEK